MNILEITGFVVLCVIGVGAILWSIGVLTIDAKLSVNKDK